MRFIFLLAVVLFLLPAPVQAAIEKTAQSCEKTLCFYWWPVLPKVDGWHQDSEQSHSYAVNALAPDGFTFANATTVMYAKAEYKPSVTEKKSLTQLITEDIKSFAQNDPGMVIDQTTTLTTADGKKLVSYIFVPKKGINWERVSYGEEGDFYLIFTISSRNATDLKKSMPAYEQMIEHYKD